MHCALTQFAAQKRTTVQGATQDIVELAPPCKVPLTNNILEHEADQEPAAIVDAGGGWDPGGTIEDDGSGYPFDPRIGVTATPEPEGEGQDGADDNRVDMRVIDGSRTKLTIRSNEAPVKRLRIKAKEGGRKGTHTRWHWR